jgi:hypothetical protein
MKVRVVVAGLVVLGALVACGGTPGGEPGTDGTGSLATPSATDTGPSATATTPAAPDPITCADLRNAAVSATAFPLLDYGTGLVELSGGAYVDSDNTRIELMSACDTGDMNGDGRVDAVAGVRTDPEGTGAFYSLVIWLGTDAGTPALAGSEPLGDRNPIDSIDISGGVATVVYFTRTDEVPMAGINIRRTATYEFTMPGLGETGHTDAPCAPCSY